MRSAVAELQKLAERLQAELDFARELCALEQEGATELMPLVEEAQRRASKVFAAESLPVVRQGVRDIEMLLAPIGTQVKRYIIYCVGHGHIDMNWMWSWPETVAITNDTFSTVLALMEEFPGFCYSQSQAAVYRIIEQYNPAMLPRIRGAIERKQWEVTASHWVEGDRNMAGGESLTRHLLYTRAYLNELFGLSPEEAPIDWSPDTFGHPLSVPMYLSRGAVKYVYLHRPGHWGTPRPQAFWWQSPDGSRVLVRNDMDNTYNSQVSPAIVKPLLKFRRSTGLNFVMFVYGVGDHGGGPTRVDLSRIVEMNTWPIFPTVQFSRAVDFYNRLAGEGAGLPTLTCELNPEVAGCYTTQSLIKRSNRIAENRLLDAEAFSAVACHVAGRPYPHQPLTEAWRDTLFSQFHDILPGSNVHDSRTWAHGLFQKTIATTSMIETLALRAIAGQVNTAVDELTAAAPPPDSHRAATGAGAGIGAGKWMLDAFEQSEGAAVRPLVIFNPTAWERSEIVEATLWSDSPAVSVSEESRVRSFCVRQMNGSIIAAQKLEVGTAWGHAFTRVAFPIRVAPLGHSTCHVIEDETSAISKDNAPASGAWQTRPVHHCSYLRHERAMEGLENEHIRMDIDVHTGGIRKLIDKRSGAVLIDVADASSLLEYAIERPRPMSAWLIENHGTIHHPEVVAIERKLTGPYKASIDVKFTIHESEFTVTYELRAGDPQLYLHLNGTWFQRGTPQTGVPTLRLALPLNLSEVAAHYEIPFGSIERPFDHDEEVPALNWALYAGKGSNGQAAGLLLCNNCKHGHARCGNVIHLTLIRSSYEPDPLPEIGSHEIHLALFPFAGQCDTAEAIRLGRNLNRPLRVCGTTVHPGPLAPVAAGVSVAPNDLVLTDLKQAEQGDALIIRLLNPTGDARRASVRLDSALFGAVASAVEVDLMERPITPSSAKLDQGNLVVAVNPHALTSVRLAYLSR